MKQILKNFLLLGMATAILTACGDEPEITKKESIQNPNAENGALKGVFSVSSTKKVRFSQGNLQYQASTNIWRFAGSQYDIIGSDNKNISSKNSGWIDLFGYGTSGYNEKKPYMISTNDFDYDCGDDIAGTNYDWGVYNKISNGGNQAGLWRTLTDKEWEYLIKTRTNASKKKGIASVNGVNGLILLPDDWELPNGIVFTSGVYQDCDCSSPDFYPEINNYTASEWSNMEVNGAVFLPASSLRGGEIWEGPDSGGENDSFYWSSSSTSSWLASCLYFDSGEVTLRKSSMNRFLGMSVRLVQDVE